MEPKEGEPGLLSAGDRRAMKPQSLVITSSPKQLDVVSNASTPSDDYQTPSSESAPITEISASPEHKARNNSTEVNSVPRRSGSTSYVINDWPNSGEELAPGIPMPSVAASKTINALSRTDIGNLSGGLATTKKTTFAASPNQTTWAKETADKPNGDGKAASKKTVQNGQIVEQESSLSSVRQKMEERRRQIESDKKKAEAERSKQRQKVGQDALMAIMSRSTGSSASQSPTNSEPAYNIDSTSLANSEASKKTVSDAGSSHSGRHGSVSSTSPDRSSTRPVGPIEKQRQMPSRNNNIMSQSVETTHSDSMTRSDTTHSSVAPAGVAASGSKIGEYGTSLDKLNSSLTELQGEILRLSLQQDHIKNLVSSDRTSKTSSSSSSPVSVSRNASAGRDQFYLFPRKSSTSEESTSSVGTTKQSTQPSTTVSPPPNNIFRSVPSMVQTSHVMGLQSYPTAGFPTSNVAFHQDGTMQYPAHQVMMQYPPYAGAPLAQAFAPPGVPVMNPARFYGPTSAEGFPIAMGAYAGPNPQMYHPGNYPATWHAGQFMTQQLISDQNVAEMQRIPSDLFLNSASSSQRPEAPRSVKQPGKDIPRTAGQTGQVRPAGQQTRPAQSKLPSTSGTDTSAQGVARDVTKSAPVQNVASSAPQQDHSRETRSSESESRPQSAARPPSGQAFYMSLDSEDTNRTPTVPRGLANRMTGNKKKSDQPGKSKEGEGVEKGKGEESSSVTASKPVIEPTPPAAPAVGFVIEENQANANKVDDSEIERRKERIKEMQERRKQELEAKKLKIDAEQSVKSEAERLKKDQAEQKKADEKARREAIFANYLQKRKAAEDDTDDDSKRKPAAAQHSSAAGLRPNSSKQPRPKSQPPPAAGNGHHGDERVKRTGQTAAANDRLNGDQFDFDNIANRRPPTPDRLARFMSGSDHSDPMNQHPSDTYNGPKLFAKPNLKSNRTIIINAIKDCCLAGSVNQDTKNKVLEEITKSEAKHFVILFRDAQQQYRGLYTYNPEREEVIKIHGVGPKQLTEKTMDKFLKYNSGSKTFTEITSTKHLTTTIDAVTILNSLWAKKPPAAAAAAQNKKVC